VEYLERLFFGWSHSTKANLNLLAVWTGQRYYRLTEALVATRIGPASHWWSYNMLQLLRGIQTDRYSGETSLRVVEEQQLYYDRTAWRSHVYPVLLADKLSLIWSLMKKSLSWYQISKSKQTKPKLSKKVKLNIEHYLCSCYSIKWSLYKRPTAQFPLKYRSIWRSSGHHLRATQRQNVDPVRSIFFSVQWQPMITQIWICCSINFALDLYTRSGNLLELNHHKCNWRSK